MTTIAGSFSLLSNVGVKEFICLGVSSLKNIGNLPSKPGIYAIVCEVTKRIYFGETKNLHACFERQKPFFFGKNQFRNPNLQKDYETYGGDLFQWIVLESGEEWGETKKRRDYKFKLIRKYGSCVYNSIGSVPARNSKKEIKKLVLNGCSYASVEELAAAFGMTKRTAYKYLSDPKKVWPDPLTEEELAAESREKTEKNLRVGQNLRQRVSIDGVIYDSMFDACQALGMSRATLYRKIQNFPDYFYVDETGNPISNQEVKQQRQQRLKSVRIRGVTYKSVTEAASALRIQKCEIIRRCNSSNYSSYVYVEKEKAFSMTQTATSKIGNHDRKAIPVSIYGTVYPSISTASNYLKMTVSSIQRYCRDPANSNFIFLEQKITSGKNSQ